MSASDVVFTTLYSEVTLSVGMEIERERGAGARFAWYRFLNVKGKDGYEVGADGRSWTVTGWIEASSSEDNLATEIEKLSTAALNAEVGTLKIRGRTTPYSNVILAEPPEMLEHLPLQPSGLIAQRVRLRFEQLEP